ncbi:MAG: TIGR04086 family membrane protein [Bacillota bacterium]|nr:TIGR04086 family membrane protein [Bacillota bacterium]MDW7684581.1 TIGR04086 family membrane protein [Bacillota bacterium]
MPRKSAATAQIKPPASAVVMAKGVLYAYFFSLVVFLLFSALIQYTKLTEAVLPYTAYATSLIAIFIGASYVSKRLETKGWLNGGITGLVYLAGLVIFGLILLPEFSLNVGYIAKVFLAFVTGAAGGIFGINS